MNKIYVKLRGAVKSKKIILLFAIAIGYCSIFLLFYNLLRYKTPIPYKNFNEGIITFGYNFIPILLIITLNAWVVFKLFQNAPITRNSSLKILFDSVASFLIYFFVNEAFLIIGGIFKPDIKVDWAGTLLNTVLIFMVVEIIYYLISSRKLLEKAEYARREAIQYQYDALKAQVNPHFLFNSLNILYSLVSIDTKKSKEFILSLSQMYRYIMSQQNRHIIPLSEEIEFLHSYVSVLEMRYHKQFHVEITGEEFAGEKEIIPYTLQLLIENVTKHNIISTRYPMTVSITIGENYVTVSNPIKLKENDTSSGIGLKYIAEQYKLHDKCFGVGNDGLTFTAKIPYL